MMTTNGAKAVETVRVKCSLCKKPTTTARWTACDCRSFGLCAACAATMSEDEVAVFLSECRSESRHAKSCGMRC